MSAHRDQALLKDVREVIEDRVPAAAGLPLHMRGGVAHIGGQVADRETLHRLRRVVARVRGVHAVWAVMQVQDEPSLRILDVGCGAHKQIESAIGIDRHPHPGVDVVADLERVVPLADRSVDHVFAVHFLEHVHNLLPLLNELHRVLRPQGVLHVMVPHHAHVNALADPTHVRFFHPQTFKFFCRPSPGLRIFYPLGISASEDNIYADLQPVGEHQAPPGEEDLARFFD